MATGRSSRIEQVIDDIYELVESCKPATFSQAKLVVPKDICTICWENCACACRMR